MLTISARDISAGLCSISFLVCQGLNSIQLAPKTQLLHQANSLLQILLSLSQMGALTEAYDACTAWQRV